MHWLSFGGAALGIIAFTRSIARFQRAPWWIILLGSIIGSFVVPVVFYSFVFRFRDGSWPDWGNGFVLFWLLGAAGVAVRNGLVVGAVAILLRKIG